MARLGAEALFGEIALRLFFCTRMDLDRALRAQAAARETGSNPSIGEIMRALGALTADQVTAVVQAQGEYDDVTIEGLYGRIAIKNRFIEPKDLEAALAVQVRMGRRLRLGEILVKKGMLSWDQHESILRAQERMLKNRAEREPQAPAVAAPIAAA